MGEVPCPGWAAVADQGVEEALRLGQGAAEAAVVEEEHRPEVGSLRRASVGVVVA